MLAINMYTWQNINVLKKYPTMYTPQELLYSALDRLQTFSDSEISDRLSFDSTMDLQKAIDYVHGILTEIEEDDADWNLISAIETYAK